MEYQWGAGCTERCKSGSERGLQKPVSQRHKALLSYSTMWAHRPSPHGRTVRATIAGCWKFGQRHIRRAWTMRCFCAPATAAHGPVIACSTRAWLHLSRWSTAAQARAAQRRRCLISASSIPRRSPAAVRTVRSALCRSNEVKAWAHFQQLPTVARPLVMRSTARPHGVQEATAVRVRVPIRARRRRNLAWA